jgi:hypothetical protein
MKGQTSEELRKAVQAYEKDLWPRGREAVLASNENTNAVHDWSTMLKSPLFTGGLAKGGGPAEVEAVKPDAIAADTAEG